MWDQKIQRAADRKYKELQLDGLTRQYQAYYRMDVQTFMKLGPHEIKKDQLSQSLSSKIIIL